MSLVSPTTAPAAWAAGTLGCFICTASMPATCPCTARRETTHPEFGTVMRMLKEEVPLRIAAEGDKFYSELLGPMHYDEPPL